MVTTRTLASGYLSPKKARAPEASASSIFVMSVLISRFLQNFFVYLLLDFGKLAGIDGGEMRKIEAQMVGRDERAGLLHVRAENIAQRGVHQVRGGVVAHIARAALGIGNGGDAVANVQIFFGDDAMGDQSGSPGSRRRALRRLPAFRNRRRSRQYRRPGRRIRSRWRCGRARFPLRCPLLISFAGPSLVTMASMRQSRVLGAEVEVRLGVECFRQFRVNGIRDVLVRAFPGSS